MNAITKEDIDDLREQILDVVNRGFAGVHSRQDITNGRVGKLEVEMGRQDERLKNIGREVFGRRASDRREPETSDERRPITRRDVTIVITTVAIIVGAAKFLAWLAPAAAVLKP